jgi:hypothetical protein
MTPFGSRQTMKGSAVVAIGVGRGEVDRDDGTRQCRRVAER